MIDIEREVMSRISATLIKKFPKINLSNELLKTPSNFPCVSVIEIDNRMYERTQSTDCGENHAVVVYEVNVYSNKQRGKKDEVKSIISLIDEVLEGLNFSRMMLNPVPNLVDNTIYRMVARYQAVVSKDRKLYRR